MIMNLLELIQLKQQLQLRRHQIIINLFID